MATLQNIRNRGILIAVIIGFALLAFIVGDFLNSGSSFFRQNKEVVAEIAGEKIKYAEYQAAIEQMTSVYKIETGQREMNEEMTAQIRKSVWDNYVNERVLGEEAAKLGLTVSKEELSDRLIGKNIHPLIMQRRAFADERGQFSHTALMHFYNSVFTNSDSKNPEAEQQIKEAKEYWMFWERMVKNAILNEKFAALFTKTIGSNGIEAKYNYNARRETGDVNYVVQPYFSVSDSAVKVTDAELKARYDKMKELFKQEANRSIKYVAFDVAPLPEDFKKGEEWIKKVSEEFKTTADVEGLVNSESDIAYDGRKYSAKTVPANLKEFAFGNATGAIFGPVFQNNTYTMAKIMDAGIMESDSVKLNHIVVATDKTADSIMTVLKTGASFAEMAKKHSLAQQTAVNGGEIGWVPVEAAGKEIADKTAGKGKGEIFKISAGQGVQIFQISDKSPARKKVKLAILERKITPSDQSQSKIYNDAKQFAATSDNNAEKFEKTAKEKGYIVHPAMNIPESAENVNMIPQSRSVVRWAFKNSKGDVSDVIECGKNSFIVANITEINSKGYQTLEQVKQQVKAEVIRDKKAEIISKNLAALTAKNPTVEALATAMNTQMKTAPAVNFASFQFGEAGFEPFIIGKASVTPAGKVSAPLKGNAGVYVIAPLAKQADSTAFNAKMEVAQMDARTLYSLPYLIMEKIKEKYTIKDNRINFY